MPFKGTLGFLMNDYFARQTTSFKCPFLSLNLSIEFTVHGCLKGPLTPFSPHVTSSRTF